MSDLSFLEILKENERLKNQLEDKPKVELRILSNITVNQLVPVLQYVLRDEGINAYVNIGEYDNIIQDSTTHPSDIIPVIFWELCNLKENFAYEIESENDTYFQNFIDKVQVELKILFNNLSSSGLVLFNKFSHIGFTSNNLRPSLFEKFVEILNSFLIENSPNNFLLIDIYKPVSQISINASFDWRGYYSSKSLYSISFFKAYAKFILPAIVSVSGKAKKVLVFDCDNTLWKGIVGEDGVNGIELSEKSHNGIFFKEVHLIAKNLVNKGVILGICSKNNDADVEEVFTSRPDFKLGKDLLTIKRVNWDDKAANLSSMATELNVGIDSFVFVDDSEFEVNLVNSILPTVKTVIVPKKLYEYPGEINRIANLFFNLTLSNEDLNRTKMYQQEFERKKDLVAANNIDEYLASLQIKLQIENKSNESFERLVQLTQKTNQFNLTTKRYAIGDMQGFYDSKMYDVISLHVDDKFGSFGVTGLCIVRYEDSSAFIDTLLLSCRVLGRNIEVVFLNEIILMLKNKNISILKASYNKTPKNNQVEDFYEKLGFDLISANEHSKEYQLNINTCNSILNLNYITTTWNNK
jgi:FkbH-like protein